MVWGIAMKDLFLGIDVGTTGTKASLISDNGEIAGSGYASYALNYPETGKCLQDANDWRRAIVVAVNRAAQKIDRSRVRSVAVSAQGGTLVPTNLKGDPLAPARSWLDRRALREARELRTLFGDDEFYSLTGWPIAPNNTCVQILALRHELPKLFNETSYFLDTAGFVNFWLSGQPFVDTNVIGITQLYDAASEKWIPEVLRLLEIEESQLPQLVSPSHPFGAISATAAQELGLDLDTTIVAGGHDQYCAALGANAFKPGDLLLSTGTAWVTLGVSSSPLDDYQCGFSFGRHLVPGTWGHFGEVPNGGVCIEWLRRILSDASESEIYDELARDAGRGAGGVFFFPDFDGTGPFAIDASSKGSFIGLELSHDKSHLVRAVMEGVAFETAILVRNYEATVNQQFGLTVVGGATRSGSWTYLIAEILGREIEVSNSADTACIGAAILAAVGCGVFESIETAATHMASKSSSFSPEMQAVEFYRDLSRRYEECAVSLSRAYFQMSRHADETNDLGDDS